MPPVRLWTATLTVPTRCADAAAELLHETAVAVSVHTPPRHAEAQIEALFDFEPDRFDLRARLEVFAALHDAELGALEIKASPSLDWLKKVAQDFPPIQIGRWTVHGAAHRAQVGNRLQALQIDATSAFGTGEHPTTRGCLLMLDQFLKQGFRPRRMADIGCGSGILAMACAKTTRCLAVGIDFDAGSVRIASANARINGLGRRAQFRSGRGYRPSLIQKHAPYDLIMSNIFARPLSQLASQLKNHLRPGGMAILSGLLTWQANQVIAAHRAQGLALLENKVIGEWSILAFRRGAGA